MSSSLRAMIDVHARLWAGEAEVVRSYFASPRRTRASDLAWIRRQAFKELVDGVDAMLERHRRGRERMETIDSERVHYRLFVALYDALRAPGDAAIADATLRRSGDWPENAALRALRAEHVATHGALGERAQRFTEGGCATLFAEGARLRGRGGADDAIAAVCERVLADEREHMLEGLRGLARESLDAGAWQTLSAIGAAQLRARIHMRNAQFGFPLPAERAAALCAGACEPLAFDWERLRLTASL